MLSIKRTKEGFLLPVRLQVRASRTEICGLYNDLLKIRVTSPPLGGRANKECIEFLSNLFGISKSSLKVVVGKKNRNKEILISRISSSNLEKILKDQGIEYRLNEQGQS